MRSRRAVNRRSRTVPAKCLGRDLILFLRISMLGGCASMQSNSIRAGVQLQTVIDIVDARWHDQVGRVRIARDVRGPARRALEDQLPGAVVHYQAVAAQHVEADDGVGLPAKTAGKAGQIGGEHRQVRLENWSEAKVRQGDTLGRKSLAEHEHLVGGSPELQLEGDSIVDDTAVSPRI